MDPAVWISRSRLYLSVTLTHCYLEREKKEARFLANLSNNFDYLNVSCASAARGQITRFGFCGNRITVGKAAYEQLHVKS